MTYAFRILLSVLSVLFVGVGKRREIHGVVFFIECPGVLIFCGIHTLYSQ